MKIYLDLFFISDILSIGKKQGNEKMVTIETMDSSEVQKLFEKELYNLYERYQLYVGSCCMVGISNLKDAFAIDEEGKEVRGIEAVKLRYNE